LIAAELRDHIITALEDVKGRDILSMDVTQLTHITDHMIIARGTSNRHVKALVDRVVVAGKEMGQPARGIEGRETNEWVLLDLGDVIVHVMQVEAREFYELERLWSVETADSESLY
jgi:ribosome-associated protein